MDERIQAQISKTEFPLLTQVDSPSDLRNFSYEQLIELAAEIRKYIIDVVAENGGHLASNLGVVELTLALHMAFDIPRDKLVWDVGHQSYAHKIITGRRDMFGSLRKEDGLSGFPNTEESCFDCFSAGHGSTSVSAALGMAAARDLNKENHSVVAVLGDGAMTGGMVFEAMNHAGDLKSRMIVVLNDNNMSISANVGALSKRLLRVRTAPGYSKTKKSVKSFLRHIPLVGKPLIRVIEKFKSSLKYYLVPGMFFEEMGFVYLGPVDGHNIKTMTDIFVRAKKLSGPLIIHVRTEKGRGYKPAKENPGAYHSVAPFNKENGKSLNGKAVTYDNIFSEALCRDAETDENIVAITAAMPEGVGMTDFAGKYPERFFDVGIAEEHALTFAAGLASEKKRPVVALYSTFLQRGYDQILHDICRRSLPVVIAAGHAGAVSDDGSTHQGIFDLSYLRTMPNLVIMSPKDGNELRSMMRSAFKYNCPVAIRYPKCEVVDTEVVAPVFLPVGEWEAIRGGSDLSIIACGTMVQVAMDAAGILAAGGIQATVINGRFIAPMDRTALVAAARCGKLVTVEDNIAKGGFGSGCLEILSEENIPCETLLCTHPHGYLKQAKRKRLLEDSGLSAAALAEKITERWFAK